MKRLYEKSEIWFAIAWIILYCMAMSVGDTLSASVGIEKIITFPVAIVLFIVLFLFLKKNGLLAEYGICKSRIPASQMLFYIPVVMMLTVNLWHGVQVGLAPLDAILYMLSMLCVGFLEEIIFRGLLFNAMRKDGVKSAILVSSLTFGIGHIVNLFNGSGAELLPNLLQVLYATAAGFMFVMIYYKTDSLLICIGAHGVFNALSVCVNQVDITDMMHIVSCMFLIAVCGGYGAYLARKEFGNRLKM